MAIVLSFIALLFSAFVFLYNRRASKRDLYVRMHDQLLDADRQHGRRVLFELAEQNQQPGDLTSEEHRYANHALATLELFGFLYFKRYIPRRDALEMWGITITRLVDAGEQSGFLALRDAQNGMPVWPYLRRLAVDSRRHRSRNALHTAPEPESAKPGGHVQS
ncbi:DUF2800 domain-containing protein [Amycolatopsis acidiphila]|uniref:DUF4760 domain-containing protein n=1 Tax=Amycolatopsis acidiphila TaxID=715473 RepID=A0A558AMU8_9PSEU|nr:hypothetical protein [Amycolatopsis acidiphila]TVT25596.1 hypothetical protein FNH06_01965 [Amycolatopsis acidiphila]UIJ60348.1 DUF2800 domain-containing protein [Amycolatopsis acidiphila]GHG90559.1 hypothetical protein GCM10017788_66260 [Amycolatopsis acidiphila]